MFEELLYALMFKKWTVLRDIPKWMMDYQVLNHLTECLSESAPRKVIKELLQKANPGANL